MSDDLDTRGDHDSPSPSQSGPSPKRKRTTRACDHCRSRKHKCNGQQPVCSSCAIAGLPCGYGAGLRKRGLATGYVRSLELLLALVFSVVPNGEKTVANLLDQIEFALDDAGKLVMTGELIKHPETLRRVWMDSPVQTDLERRLSNLDANVGTGASSTNLEGLATAGDGRPTLRPVPFDPIRSAMIDEVADGFDAADRVDEAFADIFTAPLPAREPTEAEGPSSTGHTVSVAHPSNSQELLATYFSFTHPVLPIVEKHNMFKVLYSSSESRVASSGDLCTFWAILTHSTMQNTRAQDASKTAEVEHQPSAQQLYGQAKKFLPSEEESVSVGHANGMLILGLCNLYQGSLHSAWRLVGQAVRMCLSIRGQTLEMDTAATVVDAEARTLWACFALDTLLSCRLNCPPHLRTADVERLPLPEETGLDEWAPWSASEPSRSFWKLFSSDPMRAISTFNNYIRISKIMNDVMWQSVTNKGEEAYAGHYSALQRWHDNLPPHCVLGASLDDSTCAPQLFNLHLAFKSSVILLRRKYGLEPHRQASRAEAFDGPMAPGICRMLSYSDRLLGHLVPATFSTYKFFGDLESTIHTGLELHHISIMSRTPDFPTHMSSSVTADFHTTTATDEPMVITPSDSSYLAPTTGRQYIPNVFGGSLLPQIDLTDTQVPLSWGPGIDKSAGQTATAIGDGLGGTEFSLADYSTMADIGSLEGIEWATQSSEFMHNLGFAASLSEADMPLHPP